jgi:hypothetical protein
MRSLLSCKFKNTGAKGTPSIINFTLLNAAFGSPPLEDVTGQAIIAQQSKTFRYSGFNWA